MLGPVVALVAAGSYPRPPIARTPSTAPNNTRARATNAATAPRTGGRRCSDNLAPFSSAPGRTSPASAARLGRRPLCWTRGCREPRAEDSPFPSATYAAGQRVSRGGSAPKELDRRAGRRVLL